MGTKSTSSDVVITVDGQVVGKADAIMVASPLTLQKNEARPIKGSFSGTLEKVQMNPLFARMIGNTIASFDIITTHFRRTPPRKPRSKKKRIQKKWMKQYADSVGGETVYKNCTIEGIS